MNRNRLDLTNWLIHFIHDRKPENDPRYGEDFVQFPVGFTDEGKHILTDWDYYDYEYPIEPDAHAYAVLQKVLKDGFIRATWSFRNGKPTVYGPSSAVCLTETPLYGWLQYVRDRSDNASVGSYCIALRRDEAFEAGARPVIYGLSGDHMEATQGDPNFGRGLRCLATACGLSLQEQYRYVAYTSRIDWTHEREWRWPLRVRPFDVPGLPVWLDHPFGFSTAMVVVQTSDEAKRFLDLLKTAFDSKSNGYDYLYDLTTIANTYVLALDDLQQYPNLSLLRFDDLPLRQLPKVRKPHPSARDYESVRNAHQVAKEAATSRIRQIAYSKPSRTRIPMQVER